MDGHTNRQTGDVKTVIPIMLETSWTWGVIIVKTCFTESIYQINRKMATTSLK